MKSLLAIDVGTQWILHGPFPTVQVGQTRINERLAAHGHNHS